MTRYAFILLWLVLSMPAEDGIEADTDTDRKASKVTTPGAAPQVNRLHRLADESGGHYSGSAECAKRELLREPAAFGIHRETREAAEDEARTWQRWAERQSPVL